MTSWSLRARLLAAFLVVVAAAIGTVAVAVLLIGPGYFAEAMGHLPGDPMGDAMAVATQAAFTDAMRQAITAATIIAVVTATVVSLAVAARIARPITRLARASRRIAAGHYAERVDAEEPGELGELATSFNEMAGSLEATERRRVQLVGDVAHELRTPLTTLDGYLEGLEDGVIQPSTETWQLLRAETARLTRMVSDLSELWRAEARQLPLRPTAVDVAEVAREVVARFAPGAEARGVTMTLHGGSAVASADRDRVSQILSNYLSNALRHAPDGSAITVATFVSPAAVEVSVADQGPGLTPDQLEAVFERFYRVDAARSRASGGSGIGLAIVRALADAMGGQAWAESEGPGRGATFHVELPRA
ncbi:MAG TPA: ATP-binding protein [Candidatus Limnocylindrales bacterium]